MNLITQNTGIASPTPYVVNITPPPEVKITDFGKLFSGLVAFMLLIAFIAAFFFLILGGIAWLTSGGDKAAVEAARNKIISALIGLIIVAATWALFQLVGGALGFNILQGFQVPKLYDNSQSSVENQASISGTVNFNNTATASSELNITPIITIPPVILPRSGL